MSPMKLQPAWYDVIARRISRRRYAPQAVRAELRERLAATCAELAALDNARAQLVDDPDETLFTGLVGGYGRVAGTPLVGAFVGREGSECAVGYLGQAFILEATRLGLGTCWIAGSFDKERAAQLVDLAPGERVVAVTPLGYPTERQPGGERLLRTMVRASSRVSVEKLAPGILDGSWPQWAVTAVQAARLAPSGANKQPWRFRLDEGSLVLSRAEKLYWTAPIDLGIARLHVELGAAHEGVSAEWEELEAPDAAMFTPSA
jgi:Putative TM nitroreductase